MLCSYVIDTLVTQVPVEARSAVLQRLMEIYKAFSTDQAQKYQELQLSNPSEVLPPRPSPELMAVVGFDAVNGVVVMDDEPLSQGEGEGEDRQEGPKGR